jgi:hypothetical protein
MSQPHPAFQDDLVSISLHALFVLARAQFPGIPPDFSEVSGDIYSSGSPKAYSPDVCHVSGTFLGPGNPDVNQTDRQFSFQIVVLLPVLLISATH